MDYVGYVICNKEGTQFFNRGEGNSEYDVSLVARSALQATIFSEDSQPKAILASPATKGYWGDAKLAKFLKTAVVKPVKLTLGN